MTRTGSRYRKLLLVHHNLPLITSVVSAAVRVSAPPAPAEAVCDRVGSCVMTAGTAVDIAAELVVVGSGKVVGGGSMATVRKKD